jgi:hypothetical protein
MAIHVYDERTQQALEEVREYYGSVPQTYYATADARVLGQLWELGKVTFRTGAAEHEDKRICAAVIAHTLGIQELLVAHLMILKRYMGWKRDEFTALLEEKYPSRMSERQMLYAQLAKSLAENPLRVNRDVLTRLKNEHAQSKEAIAEIIALHGFVRYMSTFVSVYDVENTR